MCEFQLKVRSQNRAKVPNLSTHILNDTFQDNTRNPNHVVSFENSKILAHTNRWRKLLLKETIPTKGSLL